MEQFKSSRFLTDYNDRSDKVNQNSAINCEKGVCFLIAFIFKKEIGERLKYATLRVFVFAIMLCTQSWAAEVFSADQANGRLDDLFYSLMPKVPSLMSEQSKLGGLQLSEVFKEDGNGYYKNISGLVCSTVPKSDHENSPERITGRGGMIYCSVSILGENRELSVLLLRKSPNPNSAFIVGTIELKLVNPDAETLSSFKYAVDRRWGSGLGDVKDVINNTKKLDHLCDLVPTRTVSARIERDKCLAGLDRNPFAAMLNGPSSQGSAKININGVEASLVKTEANFMMVHATVYQLTIQSEYIENVVLKKMNALRKEMIAHDDNVRRDAKIKSF